MAEPGNLWVALSQKGTTDSKVPSAHKIFTNPWSTECLEMGSPMGTAQGLGWASRE